LVHLNSALLKSILQGENLQLASFCIFAYFFFLAVGAEGGRNQFAFLQKMFATSSSKKLISFPNPKRFFFWCGEIQHGLDPLKMSILKNTPFWGHIRLVFTVHLYGLCIHHCTSSHVSVFFFAHFALHNLKGPVASLPRAYWLRSEFHWGGFKTRSAWMKMALFPFGLAVSASGPFHLFCTLCL